MNNGGIAWTYPPPRLGRGDFHVGAAFDERALIAHVGSYYASVGYQPPLLLLIDYWIALKVSPFVLLFGPSGVGKTELARLFAEALVQPFDEQYTYVNMGAAGSLSEFIHLHDHFGWLKLIEMLETAASPANVGRTFFLCLDNLRPADIETYFALLVQAPDEVGHRLAMPGFPSAHWPTVPSNVILTGTLDAETPVGLAGAALQQLCGVYVQPQWLERVVPTLRQRGQIAPVGFQRAIHSVAIRTDVHATERLQELLIDVDEVLSLPAEFEAMLWQTELTFDQPWRSQTLRMIANSFDGAGRGLFVPTDCSANARFCMVWSLARQLMLRLWDQPIQRDRIERIVARQLAEIPPPTWAAFDVTLS